MTGKAAFPHFTDDEIDKVVSADVTAAPHLIDKLCKAHKIFRPRLPPLSAAEARKQSNIFSKTLVCVELLEVVREEDEGKEKEVRCCCMFVLTFTPGIDRRHFLRILEFEFEHAQAGPKSQSKSKISFALLRNRSKIEMLSFC